MIVTYVLLTCVLLCRIAFEIFSLQSSESPTAPSSMYDMKLDLIMDVPILALAYL